MTTIDKDVQELKELKTLFETAVLPALIKMIEAVGKQSYESEIQAKDIENQLKEVMTSQPEVNHLMDDVQSIANKLDIIVDEGSANEEGYQTLVQTIDTFGDNFKELIETNNQLVKIQKKQSTRLGHDGSANEEGFLILSNIITTLGERISDLIKTNNNLVKSQRRQTERMENIIASFEENTARLNVLTLTMQTHMVEQAGRNNYANEEPVFSAIEDQVAKIKIKENTESINDTEHLEEDTPIEPKEHSVYSDLQNQMDKLDNRNKAKNEDE